MTNPQLFMLVGALLLVMGLTASILKRSPITSAIIYLVVGVLVGPTALNLFHFNPLKQSALLESLTEVAVLISLFSAGVKMPVPFNFARWRAPILLATVSMSITVAMVTVFAYYVLGMPLGAGVLLGAIVAPTDPVLATDVQIRHPGDHDQLRFTITCEAGMNDGSAFPFVMLGMGLLGLNDLGNFGINWILLDVLWATLAGIAIGVVAGVALARIGWKLRSKPHRHELMDDFLGLGLIGVVYGLAVMVSAWGFLAVFFAAVALRQTELKMAKAAKVAFDASKTQKVARAKGHPTPEPEPPETVSEGSLVFKEQAVGLALFLFVVARPASVIVGLLGTQTAWRIRGMTGWFGVRGIGSLYYLMYAIEHGLPEALSLQMIQMTLIVVTLSILLHGTSVKPLMGLFWRRGK
jgi:NhaP-type Na+/H+ or K+/H+ antiporter